MKNHHILTLLGIATLIIFLTWSFFFRNGTERRKAKEAVTSVYLPDSSLVILNKNAEISFRRKFKTRHINIKGQAYLELYEGGSETYFLESEELSISLSGTHFYVFNHPQKKIFHLIPIQGTARVDVKKASGQSRLTAEEGYKMEYNAELNVLQAFPVKDNNFLAWKTGEVVFKNSTVSDVIATLEDLYSVSIKVNHPNLNNCLISGKYPNDNIETILNKITTQYNLKYQKTSQSYVLIGDGCAFADVDSNNQ